MFRNVTFFPAQKGNCEGNNHSSAESAAVAAAAAAALTGAPAGAAAEDAEGEVEAAGEDCRPKKPPPPPAKPKTSNLWVNLWRRYKKSKHKAPPSAAAKEAEEPRQPPPSPRPLPVVPKCVIERVGTLDLDDQELEADLAELIGAASGDDDDGGEDCDEVCLNSGSRHESIKTTKERRSDKALKMREWSFRWDGREAACLSPPVAKVGKSFLLFSRPLPLPLSALFKC